MNALNESRSSKVKTLLFALMATFFVALSYGQEPVAQLLGDAQAAFDVIAAPSQDELQKPIVQLGRHLF